MVSSSKVARAFVLGAGLGTRLRPLTAALPKPLVPVCNRPLITFAFDHLRAVGVGEFIINTHHCPEAYAAAFPEAEYAGAPLQFRHEPELLDTAGGIGNVADLLAGGDSIVYNGDILTDLPLAPAIDAHRAGGDLATLVLRSEGPGANVAFDADTGRVTDLRGRLGSEDPLHQFTGIYLISEAFLAHCQPVEVESVVEVFLRLIEAGEGIGAVVADDGFWFDLGNRESYLGAHEEIAGSGFPSYAEDPAAALGEAGHPDADIDSTADLTMGSVVGAGAFVGEGAILQNTVVWAGGYVCPGAFLDGCVLTSSDPVRGLHNGEDF